MKLPPFRKIFLVSMLIGIYSESSIASGLNFNTQSPIQDCFTNEIVSSELSNLYKSPLPLEEKKGSRKRFRTKKENPDFNRSPVFKARISRRKSIRNFFWIGTVIYSCTEN
ncbi:hypothetical protein LEP1GSC161_1277 [Leptospira santarosai str. CBC1416]|uniref:Uncharacterized protein n=1 Tax=Leptospira santarosai str. CBC1416 TaxID=1193059 RepID=M6VWN9_9LEPT|nr:hypothetical protein LEP1GSC161_1277 [Leptospira santarosai str. CBC1416]